ncbi:hypothetical protein VTL71DRAFT_11232 [Oculimacula yallundae]|uniref:Uncharacterized protein n=1 Tax=Oculimacula yallundae TaxID=86028 RepID=A0ABR4CXK1_9HELO
MTSRLLDLGRFSLVHSAEALKLDVASGAEFRVPRSIADLDDGSFALALKSSRLWVTRGQGCRIDLEVLHDGKPLNGRERYTLLESMGCQIRDAKPWNQLILSTALELFPESTDEHLPQLSVYITNSVKPPEHSEGLAAWIGNIDVNPPPAVSCATLERIQIQFNLLSIARTSIVDIKGPFPAEVEPLEDAMLLDLPAYAHLPPKAESQSLEEAVELLKTLPSEVERCFGPIPFVKSGDQLLLEGPPRLSELDQKLHNDVSLVELSEVMLLDTINGGPGQIESTPQDDDMLLDDESDQTIGDFDEHDLIFSQPSDVTSSFFHSQPSTIYPMPPPDLESQSSLTTLPTRPQSQISSPTLLTLTDIAIRTLMGAAVSRSDSKRQDVEFKRLPQLSMSTLAPSMFSPGYKNLMAGNSRLLPTVTHALSDTMLRNVQTPSLRRKLLQLSNASPSSIPNLGYNLDQLGAGERLSSVVQSRLWEMMQRNLFDNAAGRRLWRQEHMGEKGGYDNFEDMVETHDDDELKVKTGDGEGADDSMLFPGVEDDELLLGDEDYCYDADWEQRAIEDDIEDMLLSAEWNRSQIEEEMLLEDSDVDLLANRGSESSIMILDDNEDDEMLI